MHRRNISLNGLRVFESAARLLSFTQAAEELHVTQAAVSQQVRGLENQLGLQLFQREKRGLSLTSEGQELAISSRAALVKVYNTIDRITGSDAHGVLTISTLASFASRWLIPRLADFQRKHTDFDLHVHTSDEKVDLFGSRVDACVRFSCADEPGLCTELLIQDASVLVCAPALAEKLGQDPSVLYDHTFIVDGNQPRDHRGELLAGLSTDTVLEVLGLDKSRMTQLVFSQSDNVVLSALAGQGVAFSRLTLCADEIDAGRLVVVFGYCQPVDEGYSLVYPQYRSSDARLVAFREWLVEETKLFRDRIDQVTGQVEGGG